MRRAFFFALFLAACAPIPERPASLSEAAPAVLSVAPDQASPLSSSPQWEIHFSKPIDGKSIGPSSIVLSVGKVDLSQGPVELFKAIDKGTIESVSIHYNLDESGTTVKVAPNDDLSAGQTYTLLVTPRVLSQDRVPLSQDPSAETPFVAVYRTAALGAPGVSIPSSETTPSPSQGPSPTPPVGTPASSPPVAPTIPGRVVLNEIYYDAVGSDTDGLLFVELYGTPAFPVGGYKINFVNGADGKITDSVTLPDGAALRPDGFYLIADSRTDQPTVTQVVGAAGAASVDLIDNFDPQNGPDAVQLLDAAGQLVDAVAYGNGVVPTAENGLATGEGSPAPDVVNGHSIERSSPGLDTDNNAADFVDRPSPTPGR